MPLIPEQVEKTWDKVYPYIRSAFPHELQLAGELRPTLLISLLQKKSRLWVYKRAEDTDIRAYILSAIWVDPVLYTKSLFIYGIAATMDLGKEDIVFGMEVLKSYAKSLKCLDVRAVSTNDQLVSILESMGADASNTLITFNL